MQFGNPASAGAVWAGATTGLHAFHVITGALALAAVGWVGRDGRWNDEDHWPVEGVVKYWHFVDVVWVSIFPTLYLLQ